MYIDISYVNKKWDDFVFGPFWYGPFLHLGRFRMGRFCMWAVLGWAVFVWDDLVSGPTSPESVPESNIVVNSNKFQSHTVTWSLV